MQIDDFDYELPPHLIAQEPAAERDQSRLLLVDRGRARLVDHTFRDLPALLTPGDLLVLNDTRVVPARLLGRRQRTGGRWEGLFLREDADGRWELRCRTRGKPVEGERVEIDPAPLTLTLIARTPAGYWLARPDTPGQGLAGTLELLHRHGRVPLPPYIRKGRAHSADEARYQTVFARREGAVAAPTAGLHFTPDLFERLTRAGIGSAFLTLHVGPGTFQPVQTVNVEDHSMHAEWGELPADTADAIRACRARGGRVIAVGTTVVRVLETVAATGPVRSWSGETGLYIYPPFEFRIVQGLVTNFHLPRTSLLLLVSAFGGIDLIRRAYKKAVVDGYRFYSYGDAMLIV